MKKVEINVLYKSGRKEEYLVEADEKAINEVVEVIMRAYQDDMTGYITLEGSIINVKETARISVREID